MKGLDNDPRGDNFQNSLSLHLLPTRTAPSPRSGDPLGIMVATIPSPSPKPLGHAQQASTEPPERCRLPLRRRCGSLRQKYFNTVDHPRSFQVDHNCRPPPLVGGRQQTHSPQPEFLPKRFGYNGHKHPSRCCYGDRIPWPRSPMNQRPLAAMPPHLRSCTSSRRIGYLGDG